MTKPVARLITALVFLLLVAGGYAFWYSLVTDRSVEAATVAAQISQQDDAATKLAQAQAELSQLTTQENVINQYFVATENIVPFLEQLQATGKFLGADVQVVSVAAVPGVPYGHLNLSLSIAGSFESVARTIGSIEYGQYDTSISSLSLSATPRTAGAASTTAPVWDANATFSIGAQTGSATPNTTP